MFCLFCSCAATLPPEKPMSPEKSAIGLSLKVRAPVKVFTNKADAVYFVKLDEEKSIDAQNKIFHSNYVKGDQIYLLNAEPGKYVAVASYYKKNVPAFSAGPPQSGVSISINPPPENSFVTFFSEETITATEIVVPPGTVTFMGDLVVDNALGMKEADNSQVHFANLLYPGAKTGFLTMAFSGKNYYRGSLNDLEKDTENEAEFLEDALIHLSGTEWTKIVRMRIDELEE